MDFIKVTSNTNGLSFELGDYANVLGFSKAFIIKASVSVLYLRDGHVTYNTIDGQSYNITNAYDPEQPNLLVVEKVNGVAPTSLEDLYNKLLEILE